MSTTIFSPSGCLTWKQADADVHVATCDGEFAGFVESDGAVHRARDGHGADLGTSDSRAGAFRLLEDATTPSADDHSPFAVVRRRTRRGRPRRARV